MTGLGGDVFVLLKPAGEERIVGLNGSGRAPAGARRRRRSAAPGHATMPIHARRGGHRAGRGRRLRAAVGRLGPRSASPRASRPRSATPRRACRSRRAPPTTGRSPRDLLQGDARALLPGGRRRAARRRGLPRPGAGRGPAPDRRARAAPASTRARSPRTWSRAARARRDRTRSRISPRTACDYVEPISGRYRDHELVELPPNGQGVTAILMAAILERFDLARSIRSGPNAPISRPRPPSSPTTRATASSRTPTRRALRLAHLLAPATADRLAALIDPARAMPGAGRGADAVHRETVYLTVVDRDRMAVSLIYSIYHAFGSGLASARFGINFQNRGAGFTPDAQAIRTRPPAASGRCTPSSRRCCAGTAG